MRAKTCHYTAVVFILTLLVLQFIPLSVFACGGKDVLISDDPALLRNGNQELYDDEGNLLIPKSEVSIPPQLARAIAEKFVIDNLDDPPLPLRFRKLEYVHRKLVSCVLNVEQRSLVRLEFPARRWHVLNAALLCTRSIRSADNFRLGR